MKLHRSPKGFTLIELLVVISIIAILASLAVPAVTGAMVKGQLMQAVNNCHQIHLAAFQMANDASANSDTTIGWPGDMATPPGSSHAYLQTLVDNNYLTVGDMKVFTAAGVPALTSGTTLDAAHCAYNVYKVKETDASTSIFLSTKNYDASSPSLSGSATPFGNKGVVICRKGGDAAAYRTLTSATNSYTAPATSNAPY